MGCQAGYHASQIEEARHIHPGPVRQRRGHTRRCLARLVQRDSPRQGQFGVGSVGQFDHPTPLGVAGMPARLADDLNNLTTQRMAGMNHPHKAQLLHLFRGFLLALSRYDIATQQVIKEIQEAVKAAVA
jgi:hypothetical protein